MFSSHWYRVASLTPRLRANVVTHRHSYRGETWYVIGTKTSQAHTRVNSAAFHLFSQFSGERTVESIWESSVAALAEDAPSQDEVVSLLGELFDNGLLDFQKQSDVDQLFDNLSTNRSQQSKSRYWNPLFLRFNVFDPDRLAQRVLPGVSWLFGRRTVYLWLLLCLLSVVLSAYAWGELTQTLRNDLRSSSSLLIIWFVFPIMKLLHEMAHALAVKRWGGEVHEFGVALLILLPVPYVDASDSASFANKYRRMAVAGAGIMVESTLACLGLLVWLAVEPGLVRDVAFNIMLTGSVSCLLFNGNPLLKFDSYYVLSDAIEIPSLASRSSRYLLYLIQRYGFGIDSKSPVTAKGERRWFVGYGLAALSYRLSLTFGICLFVAGEYFFIGVALAIWAATAQLLLPILKGLKFLVTDARLQRHRLRAQGLSAVTIGLGFAFLFLVQLPHVSHARGVVWPVDEAMVRPATDCIVEAVLVPSGAGVAPGEELIRCDNELLKAEDSRLRAEHMAARATLYSTRDRVERSLAQSEIDTTAELLAKAEQQLARTTLATQLGGRLFIPDADNLAGRFFEQGALIGYVLGDDNVSIRTMLQQEEAVLFGDALQGVEVMMLTRPDRPFASEIVRRVPAATERVVTAALATTGGGDLLVRSGDGQELRLQQPAFELEIALPAEFRRSLIGEAVQVRFDYGRESIGAQLYRQVQLLLLRRFSV
ncbi:MAG: hypothetical protein AB8B93_19870 [Pseudomonadales bacterium]